jgi:tetratricopeptide (TPR) repeat protein
LRLAAETASAFGEFEAGVNYRQQLFALSPEDETNHIELVQLLVEQKNYEEAISHLAQIIGDRTASRRARWQAVWLASLSIGARDELWTKLTERVRALNASDDEMLVALDALSLSSRGRTDEAIKLTGATEAANPNPYLSFFSALLEKRGQSTVAQAGFIHTLVANKDERVSEAFWFEENPLRQIIRFYAVNGEPRAALLASELEPSLKESDSTERDKDVDSVSDTAQDTPVDAQEEMTKADTRYRTLQERAAEGELQSRMELLGLLSQAAEQVGDLNRAVEFERARLKLLHAPVEQQSSEVRIKQLLSRQKENSRRAVVTYKVDQSLIAQH